VLQPAGPGVEQGEHHQGHSHAVVITGQAGERLAQARSGQSGSHPGIAPPRLPRLALPGTLVIAGTQARPTGQVQVTGELAHVYPELGDQDFQ
jgi:hypothetical protein